MSTYLAGSAVEQLDRAQAEIDEHVHTRFGFCTGCGSPAPCFSRGSASEVFARYGQLPRRRPDLALPGRPR